jgi:YHS domain-containing protein
MVMFKDPVCKMMVDERTANHISEAAAGKKVFLCSAACKSQFDANPKKYGY